MTGFMQGYGKCFCCHSLFTFNPVRVPSYEGQPICRTCIDTVNERRRAAGRQLWPVHSDAYEAEEVS